MLISSFAPHAACLSYVFSYLLRNRYRMLVGTKFGQHMTQTTPRVVLPNRSLRYSLFFRNVTGTLLRRALTRLLRLMS